MRALLLCLILASPLVRAGEAAPAAGTAIAVLDFELKDLTLDPNNPEEQERTASIRSMLQELLASPRHRIVAIDPAAQRAADKGTGYLFDHADVAATLGRAAGADWVIAGRVHKASFLFVYLMAHVVNARTGEQAAALVVEVKGPQKALTRRGVEKLAQQIAAVVDTSMEGSAEHPAARKLGAPTSDSAQQTAWRACIPLQWPSPQNACPPLPASDRRP